MPCKMRVFSSLDLKNGCFYVVAIEANRKLFLRIPQNALRFMQFAIYFSKIHQRNISTVNIFENDSSLHGQLNYTGR